MAVSQLSCPNCRAALSMQKTLPAGVDILCPTCKNFFKVPKTAPAQPVQAAPTRRAPKHVERDIPDRAGTGVLTASTHGRLALVLVGGAGLLLLFIGLLLWCFSGDISKQQLAEVPPKKKAESKKDPPIVFKGLTPAKAKTPSKVATSNLTPMEKAEVDEIIRRGVEYLKKTQDPKGSWPPEAGIQHDESGPHMPSYISAMAGLTLLECGVPAKDPVIQKVAELVRSQCGSAHFTYGVSLHLLFLHKLNDPQDKSRIKSIALRFVAAQQVHGEWSYLAPPLLEQEENELYTLLQDMGNTDAREFAETNARRIASASPFIQKLAIFFPSEKEKAEFFKIGDNSTTQFGILALGAAQEHGLPVDHSLALVSRRFRMSQETDGRWNYSHETAQPHPGPSMTCAGLLGLAAGYGLKVPVVKHATTPLDDPGIKKGLTYVGDFVGDFTISPPIQVHTYYLWSLQRVAVLFDQEKIGGKDWYRWGKQIFKTHQRDDGSWAFSRQNPAIGWGDVPDTCFALLFLQRVNLSQGLTDKFEQLLAAMAESKQGSP